MGGLILSVLIIPCFQSVILRVYSNLECCSKDKSELSVQYKSLNTTRIEE